MANIKKLMQQAASMQKDMERMQAELAEKTMEFSSGGGMVTATARGDNTMDSIRINSAVMDPEDPEMLQDLIVAAVNGALNEVREMSARELSRVTGGLGLPGLMG